MTEEKEWDFMKLTTLCYIEQAGKYLMMHRIRKENDVNEGKWIGVGGHLEKGECPEECLIREVKRGNRIIFETVSISRGNHIFFRRI